MSEPPAISPSTPEGPSAIERLERRLKREQIARAEAERIAETETRALYDHVRRLGLLEAIARECNLEASIEKVLADTLARICEFADWPLGHAYVRSDDSVLRSAGLWFIRPGHDYAPFKAASEQTTLTQGCGLPGRIMENGQAVWVTDVTGDANFPRAEAAYACGIRAAFAFPVLVGSEVAAVLEFFLDREMAPDRELLHTLDQVGSVLGRVVERDRSERRAQLAHAELERMVAEAQAANAAKTTFLAVTSHEVRTPLNAVLGLAQALSHSKLEADQRELVDGIRDSGAMLLRLLNAVLDVARIETGRVSVTLAPFDLAQVAETIARLWRPKAGENGVG